jgi:hypothetical protein
MEVIFKDLEDYYNDVCTFLHARIHHLPLVPEITKYKKPHPQPRILKLNNPYEKDKRKKKKSQNANTNMKK